MALAGFLDVAELERFANLKSPNPDDAAELAACGEAACAHVVALCGPILPETVTETATAFNGWVGLRYQPRSVDVPVGATVVDYGITASVSDGPVTVTYSAGYIETPAWATQAAKIIARHLYRTSLGPNARGEQAAPGVGFTVPNQAMELMAPHLLGPRLG